MKTINTLVKFAAAMCVMAGLASCQDYRIDSQPVGEPKLECDALDLYDVACTNPDRVVFNVSSNSPWRISVATDAVDHDWCVPSPGMSSASSLVAEVSVAIADNNSDKAREATLTITADDVKDVIVVKVIQEAHGNLRVVSGTAMGEVFDRASSTKKMTIRSNKAWEIICDDMWVEFNPKSGAGSEGEINVDVKCLDNNGLKRSATFYVKTAAEQTTAYEINQDGLKLEVTEEGMEALLSLPAAPEGTIEIPVSANVDWEVISEVPWIKSATAKGDVIVLDIEASPYFYARKGEIILKAKGVDLQNVIPVSQNLAQFYLWGSDNKVDKEYPEGFLTEKGIKLTGDRNDLRIAFPGEYRAGRFTWEFEGFNLVSSAPLVLCAGPDYRSFAIRPNSHVVFGGAGNVFGANDWRINGLGGGLGWCVWQNIAQLRTGWAQIAKVELVFDASGAKLTLFNAAGEELISKSFAGNAANNSAWTHADCADAYFTYCLQFHKQGAADQYVIVKSFKAEPFEMQ